MHGCSRVSGIRCRSCLQHIIFLQPPRDPERYLTLLNQQSVVEAFEGEPWFA